MRVLVCEPKHIKIQEENPKLNPFMKKSEQPDRNVARKQWRQGLVKTYKSFGAKVFRITPVEGLGDMCFAANAAWRCGDTFIMANFHPDVWWRQKETNYYRKWLENNGFKTHTLPKDIYFEGQGDVVTVGNTFVYGHGQRNSPEIPEYFEKIFGIKNMVMVRLADLDIYHNDLGLFSARWLKKAVWCPEGYDQQGINSIIEIFEKEGYENMSLLKKSAIQELGGGRRNFIINGSYINKSVAIPWKYDLERQERNFLVRKIASFLGLELCENIVPCDLSELGVNGGSAKCLSLFLD